MADLSGHTTTSLAWALADALDRASHAAAEQRRAEEEAGALRAELARRLLVGEAVPVDESTQVVCLPGLAGRRSVDRDAILRHAEGLEPLGLAPREETRLVWPTVAQIGGAEHVLKRAGIDPTELMTQPPPGPPRIELRARGREEVTG